MLFAKKSGILTVEVMSDVLSSWMILLPPSGIRLMRHVAFEISPSSDDGFAVETDFASVHVEPYVAACVTEY